MPFDFSGFDMLHATSLLVSLCSCEITTVIPGATLSRGRHLQCLLHGRGPRVRPALALGALTPPRAVLQSRSGEEEEGGAGDGGADYQLDMMRCLREVNVDNNTVGW